jgi:phosphatidylglycerophosphatase A
MNRNITTLFGLGYLPFSASISSALALLIYLSFRSLPAGAEAEVAFFAAALGWSLYALWSDRTFSSHDPKEIVADEFLGMYACLLIAAPANLFIAALLFIAFRLLDGFKPLFIASLDRALKSWWGVMLDDLIIGGGIGVIVAVAFVLPF